MYSKIIKDLRSVLLMKNHRTSKQNDTAIKLWRVLTALRGPDAGIRGICDAPTLKNATTAIIRYKLIGPIATAQYGTDDKAYVQLRKTISEAQLTENEWHFIEHARNAFNEIGLKWDELNE